MRSAAISVVVFSAIAAVACHHNGVTSVPAPSNGSGSVQAASTASPLKNFHAETIKISPPAATCSPATCYATVDTTKSKLKLYSDTKITWQPDDANRGQPWFVLFDDDDMYSPCEEGSIVRNKKGSETCTIILNAIDGNREYKYYVWLGKYKSNDPSVIHETSGLLGHKPRHKTKVVAAGSHGIRRSFRLDVTSQVPLLYEDSQSTAPLPAAIVAAGGVIFVNFASGQSVQIDAGACRSNSLGKWETSISELDPYCAIGKAGEYDYTVTTSGQTSSQFKITIQ